LRPSCQEQQLERQQLERQQQQQLAHGRRLAGEVTHFRRPLQHVPKVDDEQARRGRRTQENETEKKKKNNGADKR
jgi:hypothetical protein